MVLGGCSPRTKTGNEGTFGCSPERKSERGYVRNVPPERKLERGGHIRPNHPFTKPPFGLSVIVNWAGASSEARLKLLCLGSVGRSAPMHTTLVNWEPPVSRAPPSPKSKKKSERSPLEPPRGLGPPNHWQMSREESVTK